MKALTLMEIATMISAAGTLALAAASVYQLRRNRKDSLHPMVYPETIAIESQPANASSADESPRITDSSVALRGEDQPTDTPPDVHADTLTIRRLIVALRNYGSGPAIDMKFAVVIDEQEVPVESVKRDGSPRLFLNLSSEETVQVELILRPLKVRHRSNVRVRVRYRSVFREQLMRDYTVLAAVGQAPIVNIAGNL
ncbi:hypothetical protein LLE49_06140 [Alicyclobacillus tolerans]|uniref:hypothetical protein n=1 Tax=Alicyclobacillus tolerans TaxID=90970 RepID=UPI001F40B5EE|nr:hypothetical protein [Alicyclobacillus tolerans]MCF8564323.1 hypothetical protein [Alicyclobacillus tolerans]